MNNNITEGLMSAVGDTANQQPLKILRHGDISVFRDLSATRMPSKFGGDVSIIDVHDVSVMSHLPVSVLPLCLMDTYMYIFFFFFRLLPLGVATADHPL